MSDNFGSRLSADYIAVVPADKLLDEIYSWASSTQLVATKHPYGFWVILLRRTDAEEWRFHLWGGSRPPTNGMPAPIHTHDKIVDSRVLQGELENVVYDATPTQTGGLPVYEAIHVADKYAADNKNLLIKSSERRIPRVSFRETTTVGGCYTVPAHAFHEAKAPDGLITCTIVRMHSQVPGSIQILGADGYPDTIEFKRASAPAAEVVAAHLRL
jgi:hypothetical protein